MFRDEFKERYTTIPLAIYQARKDSGNVDVKSHQHKEIELIAITEGSADFYIDSKLYSIAAGDILVIPPYAIHSVKTAKNTLTSYYCICFDLKLLSDDSLKAGLETGTTSLEYKIEASSPIAEALLRYVESAFRACDSSHAGWELEAVGNVSLFFAELKKEGRFYQKLHDKSEKDFAKSAMSYILDNFSEPITSQTAANALYINNSYFCRLFKKTFGCCFSEYVTSFRIETAKIYLTSTNMSASEIAFRVGFNSCSYFGKSFKEKYGVSPIAYRKSKTAE